MTGPSIWAVTEATYAASAASPRSGLGGAITGMPWSCSSAMTPIQLAASAKAPWTRTTLGVVEAVMVASLLVVRRCAGRRAEC
ncbi:Acyl-CoA carboxylase alpha chain [Streptomyces azureus]|uniref:Acyl-CoA carboxylase alpha chain n=1 Tax=Streptomyces azureus TaxID=146537 RepID=A0A0K8PTW8_STRAJ|nr:Acyl-CoA carboxylase alpha chain [Streptomyces azureus]